MKNFTKKFTILLFSTLIVSLCNAKQKEETNLPWYRNYKKMSIGSGIVGTICGIATSAAIENYLSVQKTITHKQCQEKSLNETGNRYTGQVLHKLGFSKNEACDPCVIHQDLQDFTPHARENYPLIIFSEAAVAILAGCVFVTINKTIHNLKETIKVIAFKRKQQEN